MSDAEPDTTDVSPDATAESAAAAPPSTAGRLLAVQELDARLDQLAHRRANLPEQAALDAASAELAAWEAQRARHESRIGELADAITAAEARTDDLAAQKERLEAQLKTVIAPREAEALMHEITTLDTERDEVETSELEALEEQTQVEEALTGHLETQADRRGAVESAQATVDAAVADIDAEVADVTPSRDAARGELTESVLARYDRLRSHHQVAIARLEGSRCAGCHLDLSPAEVDDVKDEAAAGDGIAACPQCGRMLVV